MKRAVLVLLLAGAQVASAAGLLTPGRGARASAHISPAATASLASPNTGGLIQTYWVNCSTGSDGNNGLSSSAPLLHIQTAMDAVPLIVRGYYQINVMGGSTCAESLFDNHIYGTGLFVNATLTGTGAINIVGQQLNTPTLGSGGSTSGTLGADPAQPGVTWSATIGANWAAHELKGMFLQVTSGSISGQIYPIADNTTTTVDLPALLGGGIGNSTFNIVTFGQTITDAPSTFATVTVDNVSGYGGFASSSGPFGGLMINRMNIHGSNVMGVNLQAGQVVLTECKVDATNEGVQAGPGSAGLNLQRSYIAPNTNGIATQGTPFIQLEGVVINGGTGAGILTEGRSYINVGVSALIIQGTCTGGGSCGAIDLANNSELVNIPYAADVVLRNGVVGLLLGGGSQAHLSNLVSTVNSSDGIKFDSLDNGFGQNSLVLGQSQITSNGRDGIRIESTHNTLNVTATVSSNTGTGVNIVPRAAGAQPSHNVVAISTGSTFATNGHDVSPDGSTFYTIANVRGASGAFVTDTSALDNRVYSGTLTVGNGYLRSTDMTFSCFNQLTTLTTGTFCQFGPFSNTGTLKDCTYTNSVAGGGSATETIKVATAAGCASGVLATISEPGGASAFTATAATINSSAMTASTFFACITANATTANVAGVLTCHYTQP